MTVDREYRVLNWTASGDHVSNGRKFKEGETTHLTITNCPNKVTKFSEIEETCTVILPINPYTSADEQEKIALAIKDYLNKIQEAKERAVNAAQLGFLK